MPILPFLPFLAVAHATEPLAADFPRTEAALALGHVTCAAEVDIERGEAVSVRTECPEPLVAAATNAVNAADWPASLHGPQLVQIAFVPPVILRSSTTGGRVEDALAVEDAPDPSFRKSPVLPYGVKRVKCKVDLYVDASGVPYAAELQACPEEMVDVLTFSLFQWRYTPTATAQHFPVAVKFARKPTDNALVDSSIEHPQP